MSTPVMIQAKRSIQSTTAWLNPRASAGTGSRNDPAGYETWSTYPPLTV